MKLYKFLFVAALVLAATPMLFSQTPVHILKEYNLYWNDEFDGTKIDTLKWYFRETGKKRVLAQVAEENCYLDGNGYLNVDLTQKDGKYYVGQIGSKLSTKFGYFECRAKMNREKGAHTAFWLQSPHIQMKNGKSVGTEIDIFEYHTNEGIDNIYHNLHWNGYGPEHKSTGVIRKIEDISCGFHTFGLEWNEKEYIFYVDGKETWRSNVQVSQIPEYMILSTELTGWGGDVSQSKLPDRIIFDYVRVFKKKTDK